jgi:trimeric autotransporter adhesin
MGLRVGLVALVAAAFGCVCSAALGAVTPGWECMPTTAGQAVVSGGTGATPSCSTGTAVLAPTYVSSGVGGKPTVEFSTVNVQVVSGSGSTNGAVNGEGNLIIGYAENVNSRKQTGSNDLIMGTNNGWTGYGELVVGSNNQASGSYATAFGLSNIASAQSALVAGHENTVSATATAASVTGGQDNTASGAESSIAGGEHNLASDPFSLIDGGCNNATGNVANPTGDCSTTGAEAILGGLSNVAYGLQSTVVGGSYNGAAGTTSSVTGGYANAAYDTDTSILGGASHSLGNGSGADDNDSEAGTTVFGP